MNDQKEQPRAVSAAWGKTATDILLGATTIRSAEDMLNKEQVVDAARDLHDYLRLNAPHIIEIRSNEMGGEGVRKRLQRLKKALDLVDKPKEKR